MRLVGRGVLDLFTSEHADAAKQVGAWCREVEKMNWGNSHDVKQLYRTADFPGKNKAIFNVRGNKYRILTTIDYERGIVVVNKAGTHKEYEKWRIK